MTRRPSIRVTPSASKPALPGGYRGRVMRGALRQAADALDPKPNKWAYDPVGWVKATLGEYLWSKQREIIISVRDNRYTAVQSCHDSGKSYTASRTAAWWIDSHPPREAFVVTTAPTWPQVQTILWREITRAHGKGELQGRISLDCVWRLPAQYQHEIIAYGRKPQDYNPDAFQGIHQKWVLVIIDEANGVPAALYNAIDTLVTNSFCRVLAIGNPDNPTSEFARICRPNSGWNNIKISAYDTPNFTGEWVPEQIRDLLVSQEWVDEREVRWGTRSPLWQSKVEGEFPDQSQDALFPPGLLWPCVGARLDNPGTAPGSYGFDIAREGEDRSVMYRQRGGYVAEELVSHEADSIKLADEALALVPNKNLPIFVDATGLGGPVADYMRSQGYDAIDFVAGHTANDPAMFDNARSELYWHVRLLMQNRLISIPHDEDLINELSQLQYDTTKTSKISVESKKDYKKRTRSPSPDKADALVYCLKDFGAAMIDMAAYKPPEHGEDIISRGAVQDDFWIPDPVLADAPLADIMSRPW